MEQVTDGVRQAPPVLACHVCGSTDIAVPDERVGPEVWTSLKGVTSDCKPWPRSLPVVACRGCGLIQKPGTPDWLDTIAQVYDAYTVYHQTSGTDQEVFDAASGDSAPRSRRLLSRVIEECRLPSTGRMLDIGCGNGGLIRTFAGLAPGWRLAGADLDDRHEATVLAIPGADRFYAGPAEEIADTFDLITMQHVMEHLPEPVDLLSRIGRLLNPGGLLFIQVPNILDNPFDLMVVDHSSHFAPETARTTIGLAGLKPVVLAWDWAPKELTVIAAAGGDSTAEPIAVANSPESSDAAEYLAESLGWLAATGAHAAEAARQGGQFGVLGTSIAGTWLGNMLGDACQFFVDEDQERIGRPFMGRPVMHPDSVAEGAAVYVGFPPVQARTIAGRLAERFPGVRWVVPPER